MPSHEVHDAIGLMTAPVIGVLVESWAGPGTGLLAAAAHVWGTLMLSPDLDLDSEIDDRWGPLRPLWIPYIWAVKHRSPLSHSGISVFLRVGYLILLFEIVLLLLSAANALSLTAVNAALFDAARAHPQAVVAVAAGLFTSDAIHSLADGV